MSIDFSCARIIYIIELILHFPPMDLLETCIIYIFDSYCISETINFDQDHPSTQALLSMAPLLALHVAARSKNFDKSHG